LVDHFTVWRWVQRYAQEMERRLRSRLKPTTNSWRVDETYIRVKGKWRYLYRAVDSSGATLDFLVSAKQDAAAAKRFLAKALGRQNHPVPRVINTDGHSAYPPVIVRLKAEGTLDEDCRHRRVPYLIFAEGGFKGGNDARYRGARRSVDQIALPAGLLKGYLAAGSLKMGDHCSFCAERGRCEHMIIFLLTKTRDSSHLCYDGNDARARDGYRSGYLS
jgi:hypothetical protein